MAGTITDTVNPNNIFGSTFTDLVSLAVAIILFDGGLELEFRELEGQHQRVVRHLLGFGVPLTWAGAGLFAWLLLGLSSKAAVMLGAILIVSGPTVVAPILGLARPRRQCGQFCRGRETPSTRSVRYRCAHVQAIKSGVFFHPGEEVLGFLGNIGIGLLGGAAGTAVLWLLLRKLKLSGVLATQAILATVVVSRLVQRLS